MTTAKDFSDIDSKFGTLLLFSKNRIDEARDGWAFLFDRIGAALQSAEIDSNKVMEEVKKRRAAAVRSSLLMEIVFSVILPGLLGGVVSKFIKVAASSGEAAIKNAIDTSTNAYLQADQSLKSAAGDLAKSYLTAEKADLSSKLQNLQKQLSQNDLKKVVVGDIFSVPGSDTAKFVARIGTSAYTSAKPASKDSDQKPMNSVELVHHLKEIPKLIAKALKIKIEGDLKELTKIDRTRSDADVIFTEKFQKFIQGIDEIFGNFFVKNAPSELAIADNEKLSLTALKDVFTVMNWALWARTLDLKWWDVNVLGPTTWDSRANEYTAYRPTKNRTEFEPPKIDKSPYSAEIGSIEVKSGLQSPIVLASDDFEKAYNDIYWHEPIAKALWDILSAERNKKSEKVFSKLSNYIKHSAGIALLNRSRAAPGLSSNNERYALKIQDQIASKTGFGIMNVVALADYVYNSVAAKDDSLISIFGNVDLSKTNESNNSRNTFVERMGDILKAKAIV